MPLVIHAHNCAKSSINTTREAAPLYYMPNNCQLFFFFKYQHSLADSVITGISMNWLKQAV